MSDPWRISLHGGHSGEFCEHAVGTLRQVVEAAVAAGFPTYGLSEHAPRSDERFLYDTEREKGFNVARLQADFESYVVEARALAAEFSSRIELLLGFEAEVVPTEGYVEEMLALRNKHSFDYMVGSVHYVGERQIDGTMKEFRLALEDCGGLEALAVRYYETVADAVQQLRPEVVGHLDLIRRNAAPDADLQTDAIQSAANRALESVKSVGAVLDLNTAGWRKNLGGPYPAPWIVQQAHAMGIGFCFGDDSHGPAQVGDGIERARTYLLELGVDRIRALTRRSGAVETVETPLA